MSHNDFRKDINFFVLKQDFLNSTQDKKGGDSVSNNDPLNFLFGDIRNLSNQNQEKVFLAFYKLNYLNVYYILNDHGLVEDAIQEAFIKAMLHGQYIEKSKNLKAWLKKVACNTAIDIKRKRNKYTLISNNQIIERIYNNTNMKFYRLVDRQVLDILNRQHLMLNMKKMKHNDFVVLYLRYIREFKINEISSMLGLNVSTIKKRLERARRKLASLIDKTDF